MPSHLEDRLRQAMEGKFLKIKDLSEATGIPYPSLREYLAGKKRPGFDALAAIVGATGVSAGWLLTGEGSKFDPKQISPEIDAELLAQIIEGVEIIITKMRKSLSAKKKAQVISILYRSFAKNHNVDLAAIKEMIEVAA